MPEILILTGACGVGKTTTARAWAKAKQGVAIEADYFTEWIYDDSFERFTLEEEELVANLTIAAAREYLKLGMSVVIDGVWSPAGFEILRNQLEKETNVRLKFVWLYCDINENHRRDKLRIPEDRMKERVNIVNEEQRSYQWDKWVHSIDTTHLTLTETLAAIEAKYI
jgi:predicted kinase